VDHDPTVDNDETERVNVDVMETDSCTMGTDRCTVTSGRWYRRRETE
jgi:hypothetical protein